ncbi:MAG: DUF349 domain-containing protein, partial [Cyclobacteriaceae bacterium]
MMNTENSKEQNSDQNAKQEELPNAEHHQESKAEEPSATDEGAPSAAKEANEAKSEDDLEPMRSSEVEAATEGSEQSAEVSETPEDEDKVNMSVASVSLASTDDSVDKKEVTGNVEGESPEKDKETTPESQKTESGSDDQSGDDSGQSNGDEDHHDEEVDYSKFGKSELASEAETLTKSETEGRVLDRKIKALRAAYDEIHNHERDEARQKFISEGGDEADFDYRPDEEDHKFEASYHLLRDRRHQFFQSLEKQKDTNLQKKNDLIEHLRQLVDDEETGASMEAIKAIQQDWKSIGPIPGAHVKTTWANYNALMDRFYDNRSIYFELKELDRRKNLESKLELCEKAEDLLQNDSIKEAVKELNELH